MSTAEELRHTLTSIPSPTQVHRRLRHIAPYLLLAAILALFFWPVWLLGASFPIGGGDLFGQLQPVWGYIGRFVGRGTLPLWSTQIMAGDPIAGEPQYGLLNPTNWWLFGVAALGGGAMPRWAVLLRGILPLYLAGSGLYTYLRRSPLWRLRSSAALFGGVAYMLADPFITHLGHPQINDAMAWLPWCLLAVDRTINEGRFRARTALALAMVALSGHYQTALFTAVVAALYALWRLLSQPRQTWIRHAARLGPAAVCAVALSAPPLLASLERYPYTERSILQIEAWTGYRWPLQMAIDLIAPGFHGRGVAGFWAPWARVEGGYVGALALCFAALGLLHGIRRGRTWATVLIGAGGLLFALGFDGPLYPWLTRFDLIARMNKPARAIFLLAFALAVLAAAGVEALHARARPSTRSRGADPRVAHALWALLLVGGGLLISTQASRWLQAVPGNRRDPAIEGLAIAAAAIVVALAAAWIAPRGRRYAGTALLILLTGELVLSGAWVEIERPGERAVHPAIAYLRNDPGWYRVDVDAAARGLLSPSVLVDAGFEVPQGSGNPMELFSYTQFYWGIPSKGSPAYRLLGAKYIIVPKGASPGGEGIWPVFVDAPAVDVHLNTNALPRMWLVYRTRPVDTIEAAYALVFDPSFEPTHVAAVEGGPVMESAGSGTLEIVAYGANRVEVIVRTTDEALLVLSDISYPGWVAWVNGQSTPIYKTNGIFRGVLVPQGEHRVTMRYRPRAFRLGLGFAGAALLALAVVFFSRPSRVSRAIAFQPSSGKPEEPHSPRRERRTPESARRNAPASFPEDHMP